MAKAEYRSSIRSKNMIKRAFAKLLHEKDISKITVTDIIQEADISRGTFYAHYPDVYGVLEQIETEELDALLALVRNIGVNSIVIEPQKAISLICNYLDNDKEYYRLLVNSRTVTRSFLDRLTALFMERALDELLEQTDINDRENALAYLNFASNGTMFVLFQWLDGSLNMTAERVVEVLSKLLSGCRSFYLDIKA